jgi:predicted amidophosphoribosyltransferase
LYPHWWKKRVTSGAAHAELASAGALIPVSPSQQRDFDPVGAVAQALGKRLVVPVLHGAVVKTRDTAPQKEMQTLAQKEANMAGAFAANGDVRGKRLLVLDDLFDSGATLKEVSRVLLRAGVAQLFVLTLTRTIHTDA